MALQNLRSNTSHKRPTPGNMSDGQIALNTNADSPGLFFKDAGGALIKVGPVHIGTSAPNSTPATGGSTGNAIGEQWLDTSNSGYVFKIWDGTAWRSETGEFVDVAGDTMTGNLTISGADLIMSNGEIVAETGSAATPSITFTGDLDTGFYKPAANELAISTGGTGRVFIDDSGNVGIGTSNPDGRLTVGGTLSNGVPALDLSPYSANITTTSDVVLSGNGCISANDSIRNITTGTGFFEWLNGATADNTGTAGAAPLMRLDGQGRLGIGTSSPSGLLQLQSSAIAESWYSATGTGGATWRLGTGDNSSGLSGAFRFYDSTNAAEAMRIASNGNVGIGTSSPDARLKIQTPDSDSNVSLLGLRQNNAAGTAQNTLFFNINPATSTAEISSTGTSSPELAFLTSNQEAMRIDSSGNVGIGTIDPISRLHVKVDGTSTTLQRWQADLGTNDRAILLTSPTSDSASEPFTFETSNSIAFKIDLAEAMRIDSSGNVGIGTTSPSDTLHVAGGARFGANDTSTAYLEVGTGATGNRSAFIDLTGDTTYSDFGLRISRGNSGANTNSEVRHRGTGSLILNAADAGSVSCSINGSERARINTSGRLLVGTSSGRGTNTFEGTNYSGSSLILATNQNSVDMPFLQFIKSRGTTIGSVTAVQNGDYTGAIEFIGADGSTAAAKTAVIFSQVDGTPGTNDMPGRLVFSTTADGASSPTERMRIGSGGVININTGGPSISVGTGTTDGLTIYSSSNPLAGVIQTSTNGGPAMYLRRRTSDGIIIDFRRDTTSVGNISVTTTATSYNTSSDYRLKENVVPLANAADRLNQLQVHRFNFIADPDTTVDGFLAHEAQTVVPECVTGTKDEVDDEGNPVYQGIDQSKLVPLLTAALQEALAKIEALEQRLADAGL